MRGVRWARVGGAGLIKARPGARARLAVTHAEEMEGPAAAGGGRSVMEGEPEERGEIVLTVGSPFPRRRRWGRADASRGRRARRPGLRRTTRPAGSTGRRDPDLLGAARPPGWTARWPGFAFAR